MSVITTSDEKKNQLVEELKVLKELCNKSSNLINEMLDDDTWGSDGWSLPFTRGTEVLQNDLRDLKRNIVSWLRLYQ
jgi:hypothetical protein